MEQNSSEQILSQYLKDLAQPVEVSPSDIKAIGLSYYDKISLFYDRDKDSVAVMARKKDGTEITGIPHNVFGQNKADLVLQAGIKHMAVNEIPRMMRDMKEMMGQIGHAQGKHAQQAKTEDPEHLDESNTTPLSLVPLNTRQQRQDRGQTGGNTAHAQTAQNQEPPIAETDKQTGSQPLGIVGLTHKIASAGVDVVAAFVGSRTKAKMLIGAGAILYNPVLGFGAAGYIIYQMVKKVKDSPVTKQITSGIAEKTQNAYQVLRSSYGDIKENYSSMMAQQRERQRQDSPSYAFTDHSSVSPSDTMRGQEVSDPLSPSVPYNNTISSPSTTPSPLESVGENNSFPTASPSPLERAGERYKSNHNIFSNDGSIYYSTTARTGKDAVQDLLTRTRNRNGRIEDVDLSNMDLSGLDFSGLEIKNCNFSNSDLTLANLTGSGLESNLFVHASLDKAVLTDAVFLGNDMRNATMSGTIITNTDFTRSDMTHALIQYTDIRDAVFTDTKLTDIELRNTKVNGKEIATTHELLERLITPNEKDRHQALTNLNTLFSENPQTQEFMLPKTIRLPFGKVNALIWDEELGAVAIHRRNQDSSKYGMEMGMAVADLGRDARYALLNEMAAEMRIKNAFGSNISINCQNAEIQVTLDKMETNPNHEKGLVRSGNAAAIPLPPEESHAKTHTPSETIEGQGALNSHSPSATEPIVQTASNNPHSPSATPSPLKNLGENSSSPIATPSPLERAGERSQERTGERSQGETHITNIEVTDRFLGGYDVRIYGKAYDDEKPREINPGRLSPEELGHMIRQLSMSISRGETVMQPIEKQENIAQVLRNPLAFIAGTNTKKSQKEINQDNLIVRSEDISLYIQKGLIKPIRRDSEQQSQEPSASDAIGRVTGALAIIRSMKENRTLTALTAWQQQKEGDIVLVEQKGPKGLYYQTFGRDAIKMAKLTKTPLTTIHVNGDRIPFTSIPKEGIQSTIHTLANNNLSSRIINKRGESPNLTPRHNSHTATASATSPLNSSLPTEERRNETNSHATQESSLPTEENRVQTHSPIAQENMKPHSQTDLGETNSPSVHESSLPTEESRDNSPSETRGSQGVLNSNSPSAAEPIVRTASNNPHSPSATPSPLKNLGENSSFPIATPSPLERAGERSSSPSHVTNVRLLNDGHGNWRMHFRYGSQNLATNIDVSDAAEYKQGNVAAQSLVQKYMPELFKQQREVTKNHGRRFTFSLN